MKLPSLSLLGFLHLLVEKLQLFHDPTALLLREAQSKRSKMSQGSQTESPLGFASCLTRDMHILLCNMLGLSQEIISMCASSSWGCKENLACFVYFI